MGKALWKLVENAARFPRRGGRVLCVHGAVSFHRARPCGLRWLLQFPQAGQANTALYILKRNTVEILYASRAY